MIRTCNGTDDTLVVETLDEKDQSCFKSCACGLTFDDAERAVIWPHKELPRTISKAEWDKICEESGIGR